MTEAKATRWLTLFRTRPVWGLIPLRVIFAFVLISTSLRALPTADSFILVSALIEIVAAALIIPGFLGRIVGFVIMMKIALAMYFDLPWDLGRHVEAEVLMLAIAFMLFISGPGRYSVDHWIACRILKACSIKKWEAYCIAELPFTKWWE